MPLPGLPLVAVNDVYRVVWWTKFNGQLGLFNIMYRITAVAGSPTIDNLADWAAANSNPDVVAMLLNDCIYLGVTLHRMWPTIYGQVASAFQGDNGDLEGESLPMQTSGLIKKIADRPGRQAYGRLYIPFPGEDSNLGAAPTDGYKTLLSTFADNWINEVTFSEGAPPPSVTAVPVLGPAVMSAAADAQPIISWEVSSGWATQRGRGAFGPQGPNPWNF